MNLRDELLQYQNDLNYVVQRKKRELALVKRRARLVAKGKLESLEVEIPIGITSENIAWFDSQGFVCYYKNHKLVIDVKREGTIYI